ncbi:MAG TPA: hypothetical protein VJB34_02500 [Bdellovibrionota bacterium]|nr:hypothetical protein [Bdellovibrionota bacterium]
MKKGKTFTSWALELLPHFCFMARPKGLRFTSAKIDNNSSHRLKVLFSGSVLGSIIALIASSAFAAEDSKTTMRKAYQTEYKMAGASTAAATIAYYYGHERLGDMFATQAISSAVAGYKNQENYKSFSPDYDKGGGPDFNSIAGSLGLNNLPGFKDGRRPAGNTSKEDMDKDMPSFMEDLQNLDASSSLLGNLSKEELENFLKGMPDMPQIDTNTEQDQDNRLSTNLNFMAYGGGDSSRGGADYTSMFQSLFGSKDKLNPDYVGNIPVRYLAQTDDSETIWDRISKTTRKHLKQ